jgi:hypothetical protein
MREKVISLCVYLLAIAFVCFLSHSLIAHFFFYTLFQPLRLYIPFLYIKVLLYYISLISCLLHFYFISTCFSINIF